jgi:tetratricopeptide (TPR) repeat protein
MTNPGRDSPHSVEKLTNVAPINASLVQTGERLLVPQPIPELPESLHQLTRLILRSEGFTLAFVVCNSARDRMRWIDNLTALLASSHRLVRVEGPETAESLINEILGHVDLDQPGDAIFVSGIEALIPSVEPHPALFPLLNQLRERFRKLSCSVVFWLSDYALTRIAKESPDFWAWRSGVFEIECAREHSFHIMDDAVHSLPEIDDFSNLAVREKEDLYNVILGLRAELTKLPSRDDSRVMQTTPRLARLAYLLGRYEDARMWLEQAVSEYGSQNNLRGLSASLLQLAIIEESQGNLSEARRLLKRSVEIAEPMHLQRELLGSLQTLASIEMTQGNPNEARRLYQRSLKACESMGDLHGLSKSLHYLASIELAQGNPSEARRLLRRSREILESLGDQQGLSASLHDLAIIELAQGNPDEARRLLQRSLQIKELLDDRRGMSASLHELARVEWAQRNLDEARRLTERSLAIKESLGYQSGVSVSLHLLAMIELAQGKLSEARKHCDRSIQINDAIGNLAGAASTRLMLAEIEAMGGNYNRAAELARTSVHVFEQLNYPDEAVARNVLRDVELAAQSRQPT